MRDERKTPMTDPMLSRAREWLDRRSLYYHPTGGVSDEREASLAALLREVAAEERERCWKMVAESFREDKGEKIARGEP